jgi:Fe2+ transport system protein FeoA
MACGKLLGDLRVHDTGVVKQIVGQERLKKRLLDMGIVPGSVLEVLRIAPFGGPVEVRIKGYNLSLRADEARMISIEAGRVCI